MEHTAIQPGEIHTPYQWVVVDAAARAALVPESTDLNKTCLQLSDKTVWRLSVISPATWVQDHTHDYEQLLNKPTLGTAAALDAPAAGNASAGQVVKGSDSRLSDARTPTTHSHAVSDVTGLQTTLDSKADLVAGKIPASQLPSYVDDVLEYANTSAFPGTGETGKIYVALDTGKIWRWSGSAYVEISASPGSTDSVTEGSNNLYFTAQRVRDAVLTGLSVASSAVVAATDSVLVAIGKLQAQVSLKLNALNPTSTGTMVHTGPLEIDTVSGSQLTKLKAAGVWLGNLFISDFKIAFGARAALPLHLQTNDVDRHIITADGRHLFGPVTDDGSTLMQVGGSASFSGGVAGQGAIIGREGATGGALLTSATGNTVVTSYSGLVKLLGSVTVDGTFNASASAADGAVHYLATLSDTNGASTPTGGGVGIKFVGWDAGTAGTIESVRLGGPYSPAGMVFKTFGGNGTGGDNTLAEAFRIDGYRSLLVGLSSGTGKISVRSSASRDGVSVESDTTASTGQINFRNPNGYVGSIASTGSATSYNTSSDRRLKTNIQPAADAGVIIDTIEIVSHDWKSGEHARYGVIAQDAHKVFPEAVTAGDDGETIEKVWGVDYSKFVPLLIKEVQALRARVAELEAK